MIWLFITSLTLALSSHRSWLYDKIIFSKTINTLFDIGTYLETVQLGSEQGYKSQ